MKNKVMKFFQKNKWILFLILLPVTPTVFASRGDSKVHVLQIPTSQARGSQESKKALSNHQSPVDPDDELLPLLLDFVDPNKTSKDGQPAIKRLPVVGAVSDFQEEDSFNLGDISDMSRDTFSEKESPSVGDIPENLLKNSPDNIKAPDFPKNPDTLSEDSLPTEDQGELPENPTDPLSEEHRLTIGDIKQIGIETSEERRRSAFLAEEFPPIDSIPESLIPSMDFSPCQRKTS